MDDVFPRVVVGIRLTDVSSLGGPLWVKWWSDHSGVTVDVLRTRIDKVLAPLGVRHDDILIRAAVGTHRRARTEVRVGAVLLRNGDAERLLGLGRDLDVLTMLGLSGMTIDPRATPVESTIAGHRVLLLPDSFHKEVPVLVPTGEVLWAVQVDSKSVARPILERIVRQLIAASPLPVPSPALSPSESPSATLQAVGPGDSAQGAETAACSNTGSASPLLVCEAAAAVAAAWSIVDQVQKLTVISPPASIRP